MQVKISALDTLFFRTGKPFDRGEDNWAESYFPPMPSLIYGALRSYILNQNIEEIKDLEKNDISKSLKIKSIFLTRQRAIYYPLPLDLVKIKDNKKNEVEKLFVKNEHISNYPCDYLSYHKEPIETPIGFLTETSFENYCDDDTPVSFIPIHELSTTENKIGVGLDNNTRASEQSKLYRVGMLRPIRNNNSTDFIVDFEFENFKISSNLIKLGAETKMAHIEKNESDIYIEAPKIDNKQFKLYFATAAIFDNGWLPDFIDKDTLEGDIDGVKVKLLTAYVGKPKKIGGFDMLKKEPKQMYNAIPEGSVYYFKIIEGDEINNIIQKFHHKNNSKYMPEQGFGHSIVLPLNYKFDE